MAPVPFVAASDLAKVKPPFTNLSSFNAAAVILSYFGHKHEVEALLKKLNHRARKYLVSHSDQLCGFLAVV